MQPWSPIKLGISQKLYWHTKSTTTQVWKPITKEFFKGNLVCGIEHQPTYFGLLAKHHQE